jgi:drug/metabolite transporter (DMT)-like permease
MSQVPMPSARWRLIGFLLSAVGAMLFAIKGVLIKLIYVYQYRHHGAAGGADAAVATGVSRRRPDRVAPPSGQRTARYPHHRADRARRHIGLSWVSSWLDFAGLQSVEAQAERLILFTYPFLVILFGRLLFGHRLRFHALAGAGLSYAGLLVMFGSDPARLTPDMIGGAGMILAAAGTFALYQLFARELILRCGPVLFTAIAMTAAGLSVIAHFALTHGITLPSAPPHAWALMVGLAIFATIVPTFMMSAGTARIGAQGTAIISTISPVVTIVLAIAVLGEPFGIGEAAGTVLVIGGVGLFTLLESRPGRRRG